MNNETKLSELKQGDFAVVVRYLDQTIGDRLLDIGLLPNDSFKIERFAPLGDPILIATENGMITLRMDEATQVIVTSSN